MSEEQQASSATNYVPTLADIINQYRTDNNASKLLIKTKIYDILKEKIIQSAASDNNFILIITDEELRTHSLTTQSKIIQSICYEVAKDQGLTFNVLDNKDICFETPYKD